MPTRRVHLSDNDLKLAEQACRSLAVHYCIDPERPRNPVVSASGAELAEKLEGLAERLARFRGVSSG